MPLPSVRKVSSTNIMDSSGSSHLSMDGCLPGDNSDLLPSSYFHLPGFPTGVVTAETIHPHASGQLDPEPAPQTDSVQPLVHPPRVTPVVNLSQSLESAIPLGGWTFDHAIWSEQLTEVPRKGRVLQYNDGDAPLLVLAAISQGRLYQRGRIQIIVRSP